MESHEVSRQSVQQINQYGDAGNHEHEMLYLVKLAQDHFQGIGKNIADGRERCGPHSGGDGIEYQKTVRRDFTETDGDRTDIANAVYKPE